MNKVPDDTYKYQSGFGNQFESEALPGALPIGQNAPLYPPYGLYTEQLNGTSFTVPRNLINERSWFYRIHPSINYNNFEPYTKKMKLVGDFHDPNNASMSPNLLLWPPFDVPKLPEVVDFVDGLVTICGAGDTSTCAGVSIHMYLANSSMKNRAMVNCDGDFLIIPQQGTLDIQTEFGKMLVRPNEICVIQRGIKFKVEFINDGNAAYRGYIFEVFGAHFELPDLGPIGANGLANPRDFFTPTAAYDDISNPVEFEIIQKNGGHLFKAPQNRTPFDVVAWHGNYVPYKYDLSKFCYINSVSFDHIDPSIFSVLTCKSAKAGTSIADFMVIAPHYSIHEHTLRIPYYHRNVMTEFVGMIKGNEEFKENKLLPGGASLSGTTFPHGPDSETFEKAVQIPEGAFKMTDGDHAILFETMYQLKTTKWAIEECGKLCKNTIEPSRGNFKVRFNPDKRDFGVSDYNN